MFLKWERKNGIKNKILNFYEYHPFPQATEREAWENLPDGKELIGNAEKYLNFEWQSLLATDFMAFYRKGKRITYEKPYFERRRALYNLVLGECAENKGRFLDDIINGIWLICEETYWGISAHNGKNAFMDLPELKRLLPDVEEQYIDLFAAETGALLAWTDYLLKKSLNDISPQIGRRINLELEKRIKLPFLNHDDTNWMGYLKTNKVNNWNPWINSTVLSVFLLTETDNDRKYRAILKAFDTLDIFMATYGEDGGCDEGTSYWGHAAGCVHDFCDQLYKVSKGKIDFFGEPLIKNMGTFIYKAHISGSYFINYADGSAKPDVTSALIYHYGMRIGDEAMMNLAASLPKGEHEGAGSSAPSIYRKLNFLFDCSGLSEKTETAKAPFIKEAWLSDIQVMIARENDGTDRGLFLSAKGGHNDESHNHNDIGNFIIYQDGKPRIIDLGVGIYTKKTFSPERYEIPTMCSEYHNLPTVNGMTQAAGAEHVADSVCYDEAESKFSLDLKRAYPKESGLKALKRSIIFDRGAEEIVLKDKYVFKKHNNEFILTLMLAESPFKAAHGLIAVGTGDSVLEIIFDEALRTDISEFILNDPRLEEVWGEKVYRVLLKGHIESAEGSSTVRFKKGKKNAGV